MKRTIRFMLRYVLMPLVILAAIPIVMLIQDGYELYAQALEECPVQEMAAYFKIDPESELIVVYDDISLAPGQIRIRKKGSAGGHNGIKNIIANLGTDHFMRVKVGVGEKPKNWDLADYVLSPFTKDERPLVNLAIEHAAKAIEQMLNGDVDAAMNEYNRKSANPAE